MTDPRDPVRPGGLTCDEVRDIAAGFVLAALDPAEMDAVREHLATCADPHVEMGELAGVLPVLDATIPLVEPPAALKARIMAAAAADLEERRRSAAPARVEVPQARVEVPQARVEMPQARVEVRPSDAVPAPPTDAVPTPPAAVPAPPTGAVPIPPPAVPTRPTPDVIRPIGRRPAPLTWALGLAAVIAIVALGGFSYSLQQQLNDARAYEQQVATVLDAAQRPGSLSAVMRAGEENGPNGLAAVTADGVALIAMRDLAPTSGTEVYEAWVIGADGVPVALGELALRPGGVGYLQTGGLPTDNGIVLALTREPKPGATAPCCTPISVGTANAA